MIKDNKIKVLKKTLNFYYDKYYKENLSLDRKWIKLFFWMSNAIAFIPFKQANEQMIHSNCLLNNKKGANIRKIDLLLSIRIGARSPKRAQTPS